MAIPASYIVAITPRIISAGGTDLEFNGLFLTTNPLIPVGGVLVFASADAVGDYFGLNSDEYAAAAQYFMGYNNSFSKPKHVVFAARTNSVVGAWLRGAAYTGTLAGLTSITGGTLTVAVDGQTLTINEIDLSTATSLSGVASILQTKLAAALENTTVTYSSITEAFQINSPTTGANSTITFAGGTIATALNLTEALGAVLSQGSVAQTAVENLAAIKHVTQNWVAFTTLYTPTAEEHLALAGWSSSQGVDYLYVGWTNDPLLTTQGSTNSIADQIQDAELGANALVYDTTYTTAAFVLGSIASIAWARYQGTITLAFKKADGVPATVTTQTVADLLLAKGVSFIGNFATRNDSFTFFYDAQMNGDYSYIDTYVNTVWLKNVMQLSILTGLTSVGRVPYTERGYALIRAWLQDPINRAVNNGVIDPGLALSESQKAQVMNETGKDLSTELFTKGYAILVEDAGASVRVGRQSPNISVYYTYGGSVHKVDVASTVIV